MAGSHITEEYTFTFRRSDQHELLNVTAHKPRNDNLFRDYNLDFLDNYLDWIKSPNVTDTTNSGLNIAGTNFANQEHQNYDDRREQQYIVCKYNGDLEQVILELAPNIILEEEEEEEDGFYQQADKYNHWDNTAYMSVTSDDVGGSQTFNIDNNEFNFTKFKQDGTSKTRVVSKLSESNNKLDFLYRQTSIINTERLKPIIKLFDSGWNSIQHIIIKLI